MFLPESETSSLKFTRYLLGPPNIEPGAISIYEPKSPNTICEQNSCSLLCFYANGPNGRAPYRDVAKSRLEISAITAFYTSNARSVLSRQFKLSRKHTKTYNFQVGPEKEQAARSASLLFPSASSQRLVSLARGRPCFPRRRRRRPQARAAESAEGFPA